MSEQIRIYHPGGINPRIVAIGGGHGLSAMLRGLKQVTENITAIVTVADDGGSSGILRSELGILPPGDIRNCILALANTEPTMEKLLNYRFADGTLAGQSFGNLFLAALSGISGSFDEAVSRMGEVLAVTGRVLPVTNSDVHLEAEFEDGSRAFGESKIKDHKKRHNCNIKRVTLTPNRPEALPDSIDAINNADIIAIGPGSLYTSVIPNFLVEGVADAVACSKAKKVYICNIMTQEGETEGYTASDHVRELLGHTRPDLFNICLINSAQISERMLKRYGTEGAEQLVPDTDKLEAMGIRCYSRPLAAQETDYARHDGLKLANALIEILLEDSN